MPRSINCPSCGVSLNLPMQAAGRRVKCPKCDERFLVAADENPSAKATQARPAPQNRPDETLELTKRSSSVEIPALPTSEGNLRETFDLPMMTEAAGSNRQGGAAGNSGTRPVGDATALFEDKPAEPRRKRGAEARATHRRCPTCGGYVPQGMSLCQTCGLDLDSGNKIDLDEDFSPTAPVRRQGMPLPIGIVGGICMALSVSLTLAALVLWTKGSEGIQYFIPVAAFGIYASYQFLRLKTAKLLLIALSLGAVIDLAALIALPIYDANAQIATEAAIPVEDDPDMADIRIQSVEERLDLGKIKAGLLILGVYAGLSIFIISPPVKRAFEK